ncbi:hypothetical protein MRB53_022598 [Persea americana]|uniref:Uncharacterized protein n=1 Tax=Persea americana TaxID=3435 RepID=A0ACC2L7H2_PERAE|nr:hypothetical protein MRB53_022598 [Persea americana]
MDETKEEMQQLRCKASELLLREEWKESINIYSQLISLCEQHLCSSSEFKRCLCLAHSNRAEARSRLRDFSRAIEDCDRALQLQTEGTHVKALLCKGKILLSLDRYSQASDCFRQASKLQIGGSSETLHGFIYRCKKLELQSRTGAFDVSDWVLNGFQGKPPELAEYVGPVQIKKSEQGGGRGLFATKSIDSGTLLLVTKAVAIGRAIVDDDHDESAQLIMWKDLVNKVFSASTTCPTTLRRIYALSTGKPEAEEVPDMHLFRPEFDIDIESSKEDEKPEMSRILDILDVNSLMEDAASAKVLGKKNRDYCGVGLWILASFVNHSCTPNARRLHIGDCMSIHASRDIKAGEEITFAYFDVLLPLKKRRELASRWGFSCNCKRCRFEQVVCLQREEQMREIEAGMEAGGELDMGGVVVKLEQVMRRWMLKEKEKGFMRASYWPAFSQIFKSERLMSKWGRRIPAAETVAESVAEAIGGDDKVVKVAVAEGLKRGGGVAEMERAMRLGRGFYGKVMKKQAMRALLELDIHEQSY